MNVLYVTGYLRDADFLERELRKVAPQIRIEVSPGDDDALARLATPGRFDVVLIDPAHPGSESLSIIPRLRERELPLPVVVMVSAADEDTPLHVLEAGADDYIVKRPQFIKSLPSLLQRAVERRRTEAKRRVQPLKVLYAGNVEIVRRHLSGTSFIELEGATFNPDGSCCLPSDTPGNFPYDAVVLDDSAPGLRMMHALKETVAVAPDTPVILLIEPGSENAAVQAIKLGADDYIVKSGEYLQRLVPSLENSIRERDLLREKSVLSSTEARLRLLIETIPACVTLLTCDGIFQAVNWMGLSHLGATRVDQIVGKNLFTLVGPKHEDQLRAFIGHVCAGKSGSIEFEWDGLDGIARRLELRGVPFRRESQTAVLGVIHNLTQDEAKRSGTERRGGSRASRL